MCFSKEILTIGALLLATACAKKEQAGSGPPPIPVKVQSVTVRDVRQSWRYSGEIRPQTEVKLAFKQGGYVASLHQLRGADGRLRDVQVGDPIALGTVLARLRRSDYQAALTSADGQQTASQGALAAAQADLQQAKADQVKAELDFQRAQDLYAAKAMTRPDYDSAVAQHATAIAKMDGAQKQIEGRQGQLTAALGELDTAKIALNDTNLTATLPGVITSKDVEPGSLVANGASAFTIADTRVVKVQFGVPDEMLSHFKMGASVPVRVAALSERPFNGRITEIAASADRDSRVFNIQVSLPNRDRALKVGMIASVEIGQPGAQQLPLVPLEALSAAESGAARFSVFVVRDENGQQVAQLRSVRAGETVGRLIAINEGLLPGDRVIVTRTNQLVDGGVVHVID